MRPAGSDRILTFYFSPRGRISRREYALGAVGVWALCAGVTLLLLRMDAPAAVLVIAMLLGTPLTVALFVTGAKRCHDLGFSGAFVLLLAVPVVGLFWLLALLFIPGSARPNMYGPPPAFRSD